jgi:hypothetical protein
MLNGRRPGDPPKEEWWSDEEPPERTDLCKHKVKKNACDLCDLEEQVEQAEGLAYHYKTLYYGEQQRAIYLEKKLIELSNAARPFVSHHACDAVHHDKKDRHDMFTKCPVVDRLEKSLYDPGNKK